jgi:hypothetical protein
MAGSFQRTQPLRFPALEERETSEGRFWRSFRVPVVSKMPQPVHHLSFSAAAPHDYAATWGTAVTLFDGRSNKEKRVLSRLKELLYSGELRGDGRMLACGTAKGAVCALDPGSRTILRTLKGHGAPVRAVRFLSTGDGGGVHLASAGDDGALRQWDLATGECVAAVAGAHGDYVRAAATPQGGGGALLGASVLATGSYDHTVRLWDMRALGGGGAAAGGGWAPGVVHEGEGGGGEAMQEDGDEEEEEEEEEKEEEGGGGEGGEGGGVGGGAEGAEDGGVGGGSGGDEEAGGTSSDGEGAAAPPRRTRRAAPAPRGCLLTVDHGEPVTSLVLHGNALISAGGTTIRVWDVLSGGRPLLAVRAHAKLITALAVDGAGTRLLSASLDGLLKVHALGTLALAHTQRFGGALLCLSLPPDNSRIAVGGADGAVTVRARNARLGDALLERKEADMLRGGSYRFFLRGRGGAEAAPPGGGAVGGEGAAGARALRPHDRLLRAFDHGGALAAALATRAPATIAALLRELLARGALRGALAGGRGGGGGGSGGGGALEAAGASPNLEPLLSFAVRHLPHPRYAALCADVLGAVADVYAPQLACAGGGGAGGSGELGALLEAQLARVAAAVGGELDTQRQLLSLQGQLDALMAAASGGARMS